MKCQRLESTKHIGHHQEQAAFDCALCEHKFSDVVSMLLKRPEQGHAEEVGFFLSFREEYIEFAEHLAVSRCIVDEVGAGVAVINQSAEFLAAVEQGLERDLPG
jgi:hypothetical protein